MSLMHALESDPWFTSCAVHAALKERPLGFVDVGARGGVHPLVEPLAGLIAALAFEPDPEECQRMRQSAANSPYASLQFEMAALAEFSGEALLHRFDNPLNDSLRPANQALARRYNMRGYEPIGTVPVNTKSLDEVIFARDAACDSWGELIKLDTQGTELDILRGARRSLAERAVALYVEVEFCPLYERQPQFSEVELFLREQGFTFHGFAAMFQRSRKRPPQLDKTRESWRERLVHADAVFFKDPLPASARAEPLPPRGNYALFASALLLGYYDFALELALATWAQGAEAERIERLIRRQAALAPSQSQRDAENLLERIQAHPELANIEVGRFVDERRGRCDYNDIRM